ncbi:hypothetical protein QQF64_031766, partial [Cirrhinus molitorella]
MLEEKNKPFQYPTQCCLKSLGQTAIFNMGGCQEIEEFPATGPQRFITPLKTRSPIVKVDETDQQEKTTLMKNCAQQPLNLFLLPSIYAKVHKNTAESTNTRKKRNIRPSSTKTRSRTFKHNSFPLSILQAMKNSILPNNEKKKKNKRKKKKNK